MIKTRRGTKGGNSQRTNQLRVWTCRSGSGDVGGKTPKYLLASLPSQANPVQRLWYRVMSHLASVHTPSNRLSYRSRVFLLGDLGTVSR